MNLNIASWRSLQTRITVFTLGIFLIGLWSLESWSTRILRDDFAALLGEQQFAAVSGLADGLDEEFGERMRALTIIAARISPAMLDDPALLQAFLEDHPTLPEGFTGGVAAWRLAEAQRATAGRAAAARAADQEHREALIAAASAGRPALGKALHSRLLALSVPVHDSRGQVIGALGGAIDLGRANFIDESTRNSYGKSGGYLLVAPEERLIVSATERSRALTRLPARGDNPALDRFIDGYQGFAIDESRTRPPSLMAAKRIAATGWEVVAMLPIDEAFAPIHAMQQRMLQAALLLTLLAGGLTWWMLRRELSPLIASARALASRSDRLASLQPLPIVRDDEIGVLIGNFNRLLETLAQRERELQASEAFKQVILDSVPAEIAVLDRSGVIVMVNAHWQKFALENASVAGRASPATGVGADYLAACQASPQALSPPAADELCGSASQGIEAVLAGRANSFSLEYRCHGPQQERWFQLVATPLGAAGEGAVVCHTDVTSRKQVELALAESEERFTQFMDAMPAAAFIKDADGSIRYVNRYLAELIGEQEWLGQATAALFPPELAEHMLANDRQALATGSCVSDEEVPGADGRSRIYHTHKFRVLRQGKTPLLGGIAVDITERKRTEAALRASQDALRESEEFFRLIAENLEGFVAVLDIDGKRLYNSPSYARLLGGHSLAGSPSFNDVHPADRQRVMRAFRSAVDTGVGQHLEFRFVLADGSVRLLESRSGVIRDKAGRVSRVVVVSHDITERRAADRKIHRLAFYDALTQLPNRLMLNDRLAQTMAAGQRNGRHGALMFLDLDNFKPVNDLHGHEVGDLLLVETAERLKNNMRAMDTVARFGGDEFVVMLRDLPASRAEAMTQAAIVAEKIRHTLAEPYRLTLARGDGKATIIEHHCTASIGVALFLANEASRDDLLKWADTAMYRAKEAGRNLIRFHEPGA